MRRVKQSESRSESTADQSLRYSRYDLQLKTTESLPDIPFLLLLQELIVSFLRICFAKRSLFSTLNTLSVKDRLLECPI